MLDYYEGGSLVCLIEYLTGDKHSRIISSVILQLGMMVLECSTVVLLSELLYQVVGIRLFLRDVWKFLSFAIEIPH